MDLNIFSKQNDSKIISDTSDADKFQKIVNILCEKRKALEISLQQTPSIEIHQTLNELIEEMKTFGISEIDYQKYLVIQSQSKTA